MQWYYYIEIKIWVMLFDIFISTTKIIYTKSGKKYPKKWKGKKC